MTSSLVGSEMCIRDSLGMFGSVVGLLFPTTVLEDGGALDERVPVGFKAVSYTHLTLPTICSV
eukprot:5438286-Prorocentrum_lima.AAC.1